MARPKGTTKEDSLVFIDVTMGVTKETADWYKNLPRGTKAKVLREAIAFYRAQNEQHKAPSKFARGFWLLDKSQIENS